MKKAIFVTLNSFVGIPPVKQLVSYIQVYYKLVVIQCTIGNFENFMLNNQILHKTVADFYTAKDFNTQNTFQKIKKYFNVCRFFLPLIFKHRKAKITIFTIDIFTLFLCLIVKTKKSNVVYIQYEMVENRTLNRFDKLFFRYTKNNSDKIDLIITPEENRTNYLKTVFSKSNVLSFLTIPNTNNKIVNISNITSTYVSRPKIVTHIGAVGLNHHIKSYLDAISTLDVNMYEFRFIGLLTEDVTELVASYPNNNIKLLGQVMHSELEKYYLETDIGVILYKDVSLNHRFCAPNKLYEYWAYGIPVLGDLLPGLQSVFVNKVLGCLVNMQLPSEIVKGIVTLSSYDQSDKVAANQYFVKNYILDNYLHQLEHKLEAL